MIAKLFSAKKRGKADHGRLQALFLFSFAGYFDPDNIRFAMLRVFNDDTIGAGMGFTTHKNDTMEIITIPLQGGLMHRDRMGTEGVIRFEVADRTLHERDAIGITNFESFQIKSQTKPKYSS